MHSKQEAKISAPTLKQTEEGWKIQLQGLLSFEELKKRDQSELVASCKVFMENREGLRDPLSPKREGLLTGTVDE